MLYQFHFNRKNHERVLVEGMRVDIAGGLITVVDEDGQPRASFSEAELSSWYQEPILLKLSPSAV